ncbi:DUF4214 domain-containing protein, partial [Pseudoduganella ginsengisoli]|nr:DUF4214 domain-containing protein [Pseudoduganella ginsengisoli]
MQGVVPSWATYKSGSFHMTTAAIQLQQLYVTYFNRPADKEGLAYWTAALDKGSTVASIAADFAKS